MATQRVQFYQDAADKVNSQAESKKTGQWWVAGFLWWWPLHFGSCTYPEQCCPGVPCTLPVLQGWKSANEMSLLGQGVRIIQEAVDVVNRYEHVLE